MLPRPSWRRCVALAACYVRSLARPLARCCCRFGFTWIGEHVCKGQQATGGLDRSLTRLLGSLQPTTTAEC